MSRATKAEMDAARRAAAGTLASLHRQHERGYDSLTRFADDVKQAELIINLIDEVRALRKAARKVKP